MKILFLTRSFYPNIGGVEKHILKISEVLIDKGHEVTVITEKSIKSYSKNYHFPSESARFKGNSKNIRIVEIEVGKNNWFKKFRVWNELFKKLNLIRSADIIHCHDVFYWYIPFKFLFPFKKVYVTFHGYEGNNIPSFRAIFMHKISEKLSNGNICVGKFLTKWYRTKANVITYGATDKNVLKIADNFPKRLKKGIFIGRLEYETGILEYLNAIVLLNKKNISLSLDVYGDGSLANSAKKIVNENKLDVNFKGFVSNIENVIKNYDFAFVSRYLGILEALASKVIVFSVYNNAIKKDYLEMTPFASFINIEKNSQEIADQLVNVLGNKEKILKGYNWASSQTWEAMTSIYLNLWKI